MSLLITGGSGFIGRNLKEQLAPEFEILAPTHGELELLDEDAVSRFFRDHRINVVIHSAIKPGHRAAQDPTNLVFNNTRMFFNLMRNAERFDKLIFLSSGAVYDMRYYRPKMKEDYFDVHVPADETGFSKYICAKYAALSDKVIELRPFGVFGQYENWQIRFVSNMICKALFGLPLTMHQNRRFDYVYIDDLIAIVRYFILNEPKHNVYNVTPDNAVELMALAQRVIEVSGKALEVRAAQDGMGLEYSGDNSRLRGEIPHLIFTSHAKAIRELYAWYETNRHAVNRECLLTAK
ncbi:MAG TPA: NAD-dependent epimerase/dehydratase family protein [Syntrophobacteria bacterium]|nr:NAD-dependent epimerase/dehydratase family protein [Syntrophobacteria bacterium]